MPINVIFIDGSLQNFGYSVASVNVETETIEGVLTLKLSKTKPSKEKMRKSYDDLARFKQHWDNLSQCIVKFDVKAAVAEIPSGAQDARAQFAFGGITAMMACLPVPLVPVTPLEAKAATGDKHADKEDVIQWAYDKWPNAGWLVSKRVNKMGIMSLGGNYLTNENEHLADSLAIGSAGLKYLKSSLAEK